MISFEKIDGAEYTICFDNKKSFDLSLIPNTTLTKNFDVITDFFTELSNTLGKEFDKHIYALLSDYQTCNTDDDRFNLLKNNAKSIAEYSCDFINKKGIDYTAFADDKKRIEDSIFFEANEIKKIILLSEAFKIYSLFSNRKEGLCLDYFRKINTQFVDLFEADDVIDKIFSLIESIYYVKNGQKEKRGKSDEILLSFNSILSKTLPICLYDKNPIVFFVHIIKNKKKWRVQGIKEKVAYSHEDEDGYIYEDEDESDWDKPVSLLMKEAYNITLRELETISRACLIKKSREKGIKFLPDSIKKIEYISPLWEFMVAGLLSKAISIKYYDLKRQNPRRTALLSFYFADKMKPIFSNKYQYLFYLADFYATSQPPDFTQYRLKNVSKLIERTLNYYGMRLANIGGSRVSFARGIETFVGKMNNTRFRNILTGEELSKIEVEQLEIEIIDFLSECLFENVEGKLGKLKNTIGQDLKGFNNGQTNV